MLKKADRRTDLGRIRDAITSITDLAFSSSLCTL